MVIRKNVNQVEPHLPYLFEGKGSYRSGKIFKKVGNTVILFVNIVKIDVFNRVRDFIVLPGVRVIESGKEIFLII